MRPIRVDITGTTDANGNFSQVVRLDKTGEWRNLKVAIGTTGSAEWALATAGTPLTYGRGRRVTLGPELLQPFDTLAVSCTGAPANAVVSGSCSGVGGIEQEIIATYTPSPNTIALDTSSPIQVIDRIDTAAGSGNTTYPVPVGTKALGFALDADQTTAGVIHRGVIPSQIVLHGYPSGFIYLLGTATQLAINGLEFAIIDPHDTQFSIQWTAAANPLNDFIDVLASPDAEVAKQIDAEGNLLVSLQLALAAPWQAPTKRPVEIRTAMANGATVNLVPAVAGQIVYCHNFHLITDAAVGAIEWQDTGGTGFGATRLAPAGDSTTGTFGGAPLGSGLGVQINNFSGAAIDVWGHFTYSQQ